MLVCDDRQGREHFADLRADGHIVFRGSTMASASAFGKVIRGKCNGWKEVDHVVRGERIPLDDLRKGIRGSKPRRKRKSRAHQGNGKDKGHQRFSFYYCIIVGGCYAYFVFACIIFLWHCW